MKRTTVKIPDALDAKLRHEAARRGVTISDVTRAAIESYLNGAAPPERRLSFIGIVEPDSQAAPERFDEYGDALEREHEEQIRDYEQRRTR